jgi:hypothetical protein
LKHITFSSGNLILIFVLLGISMTSCNKNEEIGSNIQPSENLLNVIFVNNIPITAHSLIEDSIRSDETILNLIGSYNDPIFGTTTAGFYSQFRLTTSAVDFGTNPVCDSIFLSLAYNGGFYGDTSSLMTLNVYEISQSFTLDNSYYSNERLGIFKNNLANYSFKPKLGDSVKIDGTNYAPQLRLKLNRSLGQKIISASGTSHLTDNTSFLEYLKGLYITTNRVNSKGSIIYINPLSSLTKLRMYYHNDADTLTYNLVLDANCARFNTFDHYKHQGADINLIHQIYGNQSLGGNILYLQSMAGTKIRLKFPKAIDSSYYRNTPLNKIAINKAELVVHVDPSTVDLFTPPSTLSLIMINKDSTLSFLPDISYGEAYFGGSYNSSTYEYRFNISKYLQNALINHGFNDHDLYIVVSGAAVKGNRAVLFGPNSTTNNMRLEIIYTKLK